MTINCKYQLKPDGPFFQENIKTNKSDLFEACKDAFERVKLANGKVYNLTGAEK